MTTKTIARFILALILTALASTFVEARGYGLICAKTQKTYFGVGSNRALDWADDFPRTSTPAVDVVVVQRRAGLDSAGKPGGHVSRIVRPIDRCSALVADERGQYVRDICKDLVALVVPREGERRVASVETRTKHRTKHLSEAQHASYATPDRHRVY